MKTAVKLQVDTCPTLDTRVAIESKSEKRGFVCTWGVLHLSFRSTKDFRTKRSAIASPASWLSL